MELGLEAGWGSVDPEAIAIAAQRKRALREAMCKLSAADGEVLILRDLAGLRSAEAAEVLGIGERALKSACTEHVCAWRVCFEQRKG